VIVVDDGSKDETSVVAQRAGAKVISLGSNQGKGRAMSAGVASTAARVILFVDADFVNLTPAHLEQVLKPVLRGEYEMVAGVVDRGRNINRIFNLVNDPFAGVRVLKREIWDETPQLLKEGYEVDSALYAVAKRTRRKIKSVALENLRQVTKIKKYGWLKGTFLYFKMWLEVTVKAVRSLTILKNYEDQKL
jgi:glycosyltransferase involved in cell wall biosynthesis